MNLVEAGRSAWRDVWGNKFRSVLSFSAISIGVASLIYTLAQTRGMQLELNRNLELMGPGSLTVEKNRDYVSKGLSAGLTSEDARAIAQAVPSLYMLDPRVSSWDKDIVVAGVRVPYARVDGVTEQWRRRDWVYTLRGRFFDGRDVADAARVCVLVRRGGWFKKPFWASWWDDDGGDKLSVAIAHHNLLGRTVRVGDIVFTVVGIARLPPRDLDPRWDNWDDPQILVPLTTAQRYLRQEGREPDSVDTIRLDTGDARTLADAQRRVEIVLKQRHRGEDDFKVRNMPAEIAGRMDEMKKYVTAGWALGVVALLAGGIGIMNVTLATIFARVREIGIRRALGASRGDILAQFLLEAALLGVAGGVAGIGLGAAGLKVIESWGEQRVAHIAWYHSLAMVLLGAAISAAFAGVPAYQASGLDPVEALRSE